MVQHATSSAHGEGDTSARDLSCVWGCGVTTRTAIIRFTQYILINGTYVLKKCMVGMHFVGHPGPTLDRQLRALPLLHRAATIASPPLKSPSPPTSTPFPSAPPRIAQTLRAPPPSTSPRAMQAQARHSLSTRSPSCSTTASQASRARSMRIWHLACGFCAARGGGELREDEGLALGVGGLEGIDLARMWYTQVILFIISSTHWSR